MTEQNLQSETVAESVREKIIPVDVYSIFSNLWKKSEQKLMDRFEAMQKQLFCKLNSIEEKFDGMVQALGFVRSVVPEEANHFCGDLIIGGNSQQHMNQPSTGMPIYGRGGNNANCDSYSPAIRHLFGQFINHNTIVEEEANIRRHEGYEEVCCNDTIITTNTDTTTTIIKSCQPKHYYNPLPPQPYYNNYNNNYSNYNNNRYESSPPYYNFRSYNYKNKRRNGYSPNNRQNKFLGSSSTRSSTPNNFGDNSNSNSIIINPNNDKRGTFGASSRQRKKANTAQTNKEGKGGDAGKEIQEKKGKQVINEKEDVLKKLREWTTRSALLSYTASEDEYDDTTEDDGKTGIKQNESDKVENWRDRSKVVKEKEGYKYPKARSTKNGTAGQNEKGRKKKLEEGIEGNWRKSVKSYNEVLNEAKEKKKEKPKKKSKSLVDFNTKWTFKETKENNLKNGGKCPAIRRNSL